MYHRYQPTENGQFQRQTVPDPPPKFPSPPRTEQPSPAPTSREHRPERERTAPSANEHGTTKPPISHMQPPKIPHQDPNSFPPPRFQLPFLEKLLPNMDNGDLLLLLIMLLLISEGNEDSSSVVMTLAIFLFLQ